MALRKQILTGLASLTLLDIATAQAQTWQGSYVGGHAGYRWADANFTSPAYIFTIPFSQPTFFPARNENYNLNSGIVGVHTGYNFMLSPTFLVGIEGDWTWGSGKDNSSATFIISDGTATRSSEVHLTWQATIRGRLGVVNGQWLFYGTGGVAFIHAKWSDSLSASPSSTQFPAIAATWSENNTLTGSVFGGGIERMFNPNLIFRLEYLYENFGSFNVPHGFGPQTGKLAIGDVQKVRVGFSYKFGP
jgi:outer membrane immunogenic protein